MTALPISVLMSACNYNQVSFAFSVIVSLVYLRSLQFAPHDVHGVPQRRDGRAQADGLLPEPEAQRLRRVGGDGGQL